MEPCGLLFSMGAAGAPEGAQGLLFHPAPSPAQVSELQQLRVQLEGQVDSLAGKLEGAEAEKARLRVRFLPLGTCLPCDHSARDSSIILRYPLHLLGILCMGNNRVHVLTEKAKELLVSRLCCVASWPSIGCCCSACLGTVVQPVGPAQL